MPELPFSREIICARDLLKKYNGKTVVDNISFTVTRGECFGILGPNGAGKTTTVKMIHALSPPTAGKLKVLGQDVTKKGREIKKRLGVVTQDNNLDPDLTVWENMEMFARYYRLQPPRVRAHLHRLLALMELADYCHTRVEKLSGGMKRRLAIARSLISSPDLLILDEPTTGLDPHARHVVWQQLRLIKENDITILLTTHYLEEAAHLCDRLVIMARGLILEEGRPRDLVQKHIGHEVLELRLAERPELWREKFAASFKELIAGHFLLGDVLYLYTFDGNELLKGIQQMSPPCRYHLLRSATLEDVFLKLTGRDLSA